MGNMDSRDAFSFHPLGLHSDGTVITSAVTLTPPTGATKLLIQALGQNILYTLDDSDPTATKGFTLKVGNPPVQIPIGKGTVIKVIEEAATADMQYQWGF